MADTICWGILGPGSIAKKFAEGLRAVPGARLVAVGSRDAGRAKAFAEAHGAVRAHGSYEALAADPGVDVVYVASPHSGHAEHTLLCLNHGKAVLCEKPFAVNAVQGRGMVECARAKRLFLMEAMWTRFLPAMVEVRRWIEKGLIGEPRLVTADFGFRAGWNPESRLLNPRLAGGGLLDVGVYTLAMAFMVFRGRPEVVTGVAHVGETGVDEQAAMALRFSGGRLASLTCAVRTNTTQAVRINGTDGYIEIPGFWRAQEATLAEAGKEPRRVALPFESTGYNYEAAAVGQCLRDGQQECAVMPLDETLQIAETMDALRRQWGLVYPGE